MARRMSRLVFTPEIWVSARARWALRTTLSQDDAVMMSLAMRLSKSADTTEACPLRRWVSMRMPLPVGNWKDVILPIDRDQSLCTFSAVMRSWIEWAGGGTAGSRPEEDGSPQFERLQP